MQRIAIFLLALALVACSTTPPPPPPIGEQMTALRMRLFIVVEEKRHRLEARAKPLMLDPALTTAAQAHAEAMANAGALDNKSGAENPAMKPLVDDPQFQGLIAENVGHEFYWAPRGIDVDKVAQAILDRWVASERHKWTLSFYAFNRTGIGVATDGKGIYVSQVFANDLPIPDAPPPARPPVPAPKP